MCKRSALVSLFGIVALAIAGCSARGGAGNVSKGPPADTRPRVNPDSADSKNKGTSSEIVEKRLSRDVKEDSSAPRGTGALEAASAQAAGGTGQGSSSATLRTIHFGFDDYTLNSEARGILSVNAGHLSSNPAVLIRVEGHCDERGTTEYNLALGEKRAMSAYQFMSDLGIAAGRMQVVSYGEERPVNTRSNEEAWAQNRRADFVEVGK